MSHLARPFLPSLRGVALLLPALLLAGCLPSSCRRQESRALFPADSVSRARAAATPVDTLRAAWTAAGAPLAHPRTVRFDAAGRLYVADTGQHRVVVFGPDGAPVAAVGHPRFRYPYLAGAWADTAAVYVPGAHRLFLVAGGQVVDSLATPADGGDDALRWAVAHGSDVFVKTVPPDGGGFVAHLDRRGREQARRRLHGPAWRHAGLLRLRADTLLSLTGYRPVVDVFAPGAAAPDTLALVGFDSPMLARSRAFVLGGEGEAPLLTPSADVAGPFLFVLNLRAGWLQVDVYDRAGRLQRVLVQEHPAYDRRFYPVDLAVQALPGGTYRLAVALLQPQPAVAVYHWHPAP